MRWTRAWYHANILFYNHFGWKQNSCKGFKVNIQVQTGAKKKETAHILRSSPAEKPHNI